MNFIIEVIKCHPESDDVVFVVRRHDGFPLLVADDLDTAKDFISQQIEKALSASKTDD